eukprot:990308-Pleurochrysis_carterae.AAC.1
MSIPFQNDSGYGVVNEAGRLSAVSSTMFAALCYHDNVALLPCPQRLFYHVIFHSWIELPCSDAPINQLGAGRYCCYLRIPWRRTSLSLRPMMAL